MISKIIYGLGFFPKAAGSERQVTLLISLVVLAVFSAFMHYLYITLFKQVIDAEIEFKSRYLVIIPVSYLLYQHIGSFGGIPKDGPYNFRHLFSLLLINIVGFLTYVLCAKYILKTYYGIKSASQAAAAEKQLEMQREQYERIISSFNASARLRHDWRHHMLTLTGYAERNELEQIKTYLNSYNGKHLWEDEAPMCRNSSVDLILRHFVAMARDGGVETTISVDIPSELPISDPELGIVFGNLLENAVEACLRQTEGRRFLTLRASVVGSQLVVWVQNSFGVAPKATPEGFYSSKRDGNGIGLSSVKSIAKQSGGSFSVFADDSVFTTEVILNL